MKVKMILPALTEAVSPYWRPIKYSLFPPLGLATLAGYLEDSDDVTIQNEHVEKLVLDDTPDLVAIEVYITSAYRSYAIADYYRSRGIHVALGGVHVTAMPEEAAQHADTIFIGPGEDTWPVFLSDFKQGTPKRVYRSTVRSLAGQPNVRRDLIDRNLYLVPNSIVVSRGCPHRCDFCYKESFFANGKSFYTQPVDAALAEIESLPGKHLFFLDDNLFADCHFAEALFDGMKGMNQLWQAAGTIMSVFHPRLMEKAADCGLRGLFIGFETLDSSNLRSCGKYHNMQTDYAAAVRRLHDLGIMINGSFVFGLDHDDADAPKRTVEWAIRQGIETATFHILTPYPGTKLYERLSSEGRIKCANWDLYDTRHVVYRPVGMTAMELQRGYQQAYENFYKWKSIFKGAWVKDKWADRLRHVAYAGGWKKMEPIWNCVIRAKHVSSFKPLMEMILAGNGKSTNRIRSTTTDAEAGTVLPLERSA